MIRSDILHAKTTQVSAAHQREVSSLGRIQERENRALDDVKRRERKFWREIALASTAKSDGRAGVSQAPQGVPLERALEAHRLLKEAKDQHRGVTQELRAQVSKVMRTKLAVDTFTKMRRKDRVRQEHQRADRIGEQTEEVMNIRLTQRNSRVARGALKEAREICDVGASKEARRDGGLPIPPRSIDLNPQPTILEASSAKNVNTSIRVSDAISLQSLHVDTRSSTPTLTVNVDHAGAPLACRLAATPSGEVGVVVGTSQGNLSERLARGRPGILAKLSELGIKVSTFEVRRDSGFDSPSGGAMKRGRRTQEERDENTIA